MKPKIGSKHSLYLNACGNVLRQYTGEPEQPLQPLACKAIVYGVKAINSKTEPEFIEREEAERDFQLANALLGLMSLLTPAEFVNLFPIRKDYKGHKWGTKDYFYVRDYVKTLDQGEPIGGKILDFLWEYHNLEISLFMVELMSAMSRLRRLDGQPSLGQELADIMGLKTYKMYTDDKGKQYLLDPQTGKTIRAKPTKRRHLKIAK